MGTFLKYRLNRVMRKSSGHPFPFDRCARRCNIFFDPTKVRGVAQPKRTLFTKVTKWAIFNKHPWNNRPPASIRKAIR